MKTHKNHKPTFNSRHFLQARNKPTKLSCSVVCRLVLAICIGVAIGPKQQQAATVRPRLVSPFIGKPISSDSIYTLTLLVMSVGVSAGNTASVPH